MIGEKPQYTFEDWISNRFWREKDYTGRAVCNDSENYLHLVQMGKMSYDVLNKIQEEQNNTYEYMIKCSLEINERFFKRLTKDSLDLQKVIYIKIKRIETFLEANEGLYYDAILPRLHRGIKVGAKYIIPEQYLRYKNLGSLDAFIIQPVAPYHIYVGNKSFTLPTSEQMIHAQIEVKVLWLKKLMEYKKQVTKNETSYLR